MNECHVENLICREQVNAGRTEVKLTPELVTDWFGVSDRLVTATADRACGDVAVAAFSKRGNLELEIQR